MVGWRGLGRQRREEMVLAVYRGETRRIRKGLLGRKGQHSQGDGNAHTIPYVMGFTSLDSTERTSHGGDSL